MKLETLSAYDLGKLVRSKKISPVEVIQYFGDRIDNRNSRVNAFTYTKLDDAMHEALKLERRILRGEAVGPFAGVPVALKDFLPSKKGWTNSHGGVEALVQVDPCDSMFYQAARNLGAIAVGKTNAPAFGFSGTCKNKMYGSTKNPFNPEYSSGGSSGGSAAAVADGLVLMAEGGDAGGSIRIPASWCNLFGFKPSLGTVPSYCRPDGWSATHPYCFNGGLTKTVKDSAILLNAMAQYNPRDPISLPINANKDFVKLRRNSIKGKRIAFTFNFNMFPVDSEVAEVVYTRAVQLKDEGASIEPVEFHFAHSLDEIFECWAWAISLDTYLDIYNWKQGGLDIVRDHRNELPEEFIKFNDMAGKANVHSMRKFNEIRTDILDNFEDVLEEYDAILSPVTICPPIAIQQDGRCKSVAGVSLNPQLNFIEFAETALVNFIGYPAASVPAGMTEKGLPIGIQIIGKQYRDEDVFAIAHKFEKLEPWSYEKSMN